MHRIIYHHTNPLLPSTKMPSSSTTSRPKGPPAPVPNPPNTKHESSIKLKQYLKQQKQAALAAPPPTHTTALLMSYLDNDDDNARQKKINKRKRATSTVTTVRTSATSNGAKSVINQGKRSKKVEKSKTKNDIWAKVTSSSSSSSSMSSSNQKNAKNIFPSRAHGSISSAGTLDDLLAPPRKRMVMMNTKKEQQLKSKKSALILTPAPASSSGSASVTQQLKDSTKKITNGQCNMNSSNMHNHNHNDDNDTNTTLPLPLSSLTKTSSSSTTTKSIFKSNNAKNNKHLRLGNNIFQSKVNRNRHGRSNPNNFQHKAVSSSSSSLLLSSSTTSSISETIISSSNNININKSTTTSLQSNNATTSRPIINNVPRSHNNNNNLLPLTSNNDAGNTSYSSHISPYGSSISSRNSYNNQYTAKGSIIDSVERNNIENDTKQTMQKNNIRTKTTKNDNFIRLNLRNNAGSCKGARNLRKHNRQKRWKAKRRDEFRDMNEMKYQSGRSGENNGDSDDDTTTIVPTQKSNKGRRINSVYDAIDPIDDYLDGTFHLSKKPTSTATLTTNNKANTNNKDDTTTTTIKANTNNKDDTPIIPSSEHPSCTRHNRQCKLLIVKKNTTGNKGRKFYVCSMPRGEQCNFFQWEDDTVESTRNELLQASSQSGFIARQVTSHMDRFKTLTVPELKSIAKQRHLNSTGKKSTLITRLAVWVRDEICRDHNDNDGSESIAPIKELDDQSTHSDSEDTHDSFVDDNSSISSEELEICEEPKKLTKSAEKLISEDNDAIDVDRFKSPLHLSLYDIFGYTDFRTGQEWAIRRCLEKKRSLLVAPTGMGKSLCYALPAALMDGICIVVSPLISLIEDQLRHLPPRIPSATLSGNISKKKMALLIDDLLSSRLKILFVSPEKLTSAAFRRLLRPKYNSEKKCYERQLPPVSLLCLDEAHCLSQWGHSFRSSYLRIRSIMDSLEPQGVLALTATAGKHVVDDICDTLDIPRCKDSSDDCVQILSCNRDNIGVSAISLHHEDQKLQALMKLIREPSKQKSKSRSPSTVCSHTKDLAADDLTGCLSKGSVIIYVWRKKDAETISEQLQAVGVDGGVICYHGGMDTNARSKAQSKFMRGKVRICVATIAFGLGINKPDIKGVIHLCLPSSPENYLQEIGRAGRDGSPAQAVALVVESEVSQKHSLSFTNKVATTQVHIFFAILQHLIKDAIDTSASFGESGSITSLNVAVSIDPIVKSIDIKEETILTFLSLLEKNTSDFPKMLDIEGIIPENVIVTMKLRSLEELAKTETIGQCILTCGKTLDVRASKWSRNKNDSGFDAYSFGSVQFSVVQCSRLLGPDAEPRHVYAALRRLQTNGELELRFDNDSGRSIFLKINEHGLNYFHTPDDCESAENRLSHLVHSMSEYLSQQAINQCKKVLKMHKIFQHITVEAGEERNDKSKSQNLKVFQRIIDDYFNNPCIDNTLDAGQLIQKVSGKDKAIMNCLRRDVLNLLQDTSLKVTQSFSPHQVRFGDIEQSDYTVMLITKILHGIPSPNTPSLNWYNHPLWGKYKCYDFMNICSNVQTIICGE